MTSRDPLSLQNFLFTCARSLGGTWRPAPCVIGDVAIRADEANVLGDGSTMRLSIIITAQAIDTDKPRLHLTHLLNVKTVASTKEVHESISGLIESGYDIGTYSRDGIGDPLVVYSANGTNAGSIQRGSASYHR